MAFLSKLDHHNRITKMENASVNVQLILLGALIGSAFWLGVFYVFLESAARFFGGLCTLLIIETASWTLAYFLGGLVVWWWHADRRKLAVVMAVVLLGLFGVFVWALIAGLILTPWHVVPVVVALLSAALCYPRLCERADGLTWGNHFWL